MLFDVAKREMIYLAAERDEFLIPVFGLDAEEVRGGAEARGGLPIIFTYHSAGTMDHESKAHGVQSDSNRDRDCNHDVKNQVCLLS